jgi:hypothetical protein
MQENRNHLVEVSLIFFRNLRAGYQLEFNARMLRFQRGRKAVAQVLRDRVPHRVYGRVISQAEPPRAICFALGSSQQSSLQINGTAAPRI